MATSTIAITRTDAWRRAEAIRTGCNVPEEVFFSLPLPSVSREVREILLHWSDDDGTFPGGDEAFRMKYWTDYTPRGGTYWRLEPVVVDGQISTDTVAAAIVAAYGRLQAARQRYEQEQRVAGLCERLAQLTDPNNAELRTLARILCSLLAPEDLRAIGVTNS